MQTVKETRTPFAALPRQEKRQVQQVSSHGASWKIYQATCPTFARAGIESCFAYNYSFLTTLTVRMTHWAINYVFDLV